MGSSVRRTRDGPASRWRLGTCIVRGSSRGHFNDLLATARLEFDASVDKALCSSTTPVPSITRSFDYAKAATTLLEHGVDADLMVLGARGRGGVAAAILGSVTNAVLHQAPCPVVVVPTDDAS